DGLCLLSRHDPSLLHFGRHCGRCRQGRRTDRRGTAQAMMRKFLLGAAIALLAWGSAVAREFTSTITESAAITQMRPEFRRPDEPNQLFYVQRSPNSNTVIYAARLDSKGALDRREPVEGFWRKFNIDGSRQPL